MAQLQANRTLSGSFASVWVDGALIAELESITVKVKLQRERVQLGMDVDSKITGYSGEGTMKLKQVYTRFYEVLDEARRGVDKRCTITTALKDPDAADRHDAQTMRRQQARAERGRTLAVTDTEPGFKGDTATNTTKPATFETGVELQVPTFVEIGDVLQIDTRDGRVIKDDVLRALDAPRAAVRAALTWPEARITGLDYWGAMYNYSQALCERNAASEGVGKQRVFVLRDSMKPQMYGDMNAFAQELRDMGFTEVRYAETSEAIFGSKRRAAMMMLGSSGMLVGRK